jgi:ethanolamine utilization protein EutQ (cupin superfamily)
MIDELVGRANTGTESLSIAHMHSPDGWSEPGQTPGFDEWTYVLEGHVEVEFRDGHLAAGKGAALHVSRGTWVRYSTPGGAEYISVCVPAFSPENVHRDEE